MPQCGDGRGDRAVTQMISDQGFKTSFPVVWSRARAHLWWRGPVALYPSERGALERVRDASARARLTAIARRRATTAERIVAYAPPRMAAVPRHRRRTVGRAARRCPMRPLRLFSLAIVPFALAACDADPVRPPPVPDSGPRLAAAAADACAVDGDLTVREIHPPGAERSRAIAVNDLGEVVVVDDETGAAFLWSAASGFQPIPIESPRAVNNQSQVVGTNGQYGESVPLLWSPSGGLQSLALPAGYAHAVAYDINNAGVIVGGAVAYPAALPLRWVGGVPDPLFLPEDLYGPPSPANAVNDRGDVVGTVWPESYVYSLIWPNDGDVPVQAGGLVHDINDARQF